MVSLFTTKAVGDRDASNPAFEIKLHKSSATYPAGEIISGDVVIITTTPLDVNNITLQFHGSGKVDLSRLQSIWSRNKSPIENPVMEETFLEDYIYSMFLFGNQNDEVCTLPPGTKTIPFTFNLPEFCPSSVSKTLTGAFNLGPHAENQYFIRGVMKLYQNPNPPRCVLPFIVQGKVDLNLIPGVELPLNVKKSKTPHSPFWQHVKGVVHLGLQLSRTGFVIGENLHSYMNAIVTNESNIRLSSPRALILQLVTFSVQSAQGRKLREVNEVAKIKWDEIPPGETMNLAEYSGSRRSWEDWNNWKIPEVPPTRFGLRGCKNIDVQYFLRVEVIRLLHDVLLFVEVPITIGTIPLRNEPHPPANLVGISTIDNSIPDDLPPTYDEAVGINNTVL